MKKAVIFISLFSSSVFAAPVGETFSGIGIGLDLNTVKYKSAGFKDKQATSANLVLDYGIDYGYQFVGLIEGKVKLGSVKIFNDTKQKNQFSLGYKQGYRIFSDLLPYIKLDYSLSKVGDIGTFKGLGYGAGVKYAVSNDLEVGVEYVRSNLKYHGTKLKGNSFSTGIAYRF